MGVEMSNAIGSKTVSRAISYELSSYELRAGAVEFLRGSQYDIGEQAEFVEDGGGGLGGIDAVGECGGTGGGAV
jgi:hypothetical protein